jgi:hypothetical protein
MARKSGDEEMLIQALAGTLITAFSNCFLSIATYILP